MTGDLQSKPRRRGRPRRGSEVRRVIDELRGLTRAANGARQEGADEQELAATLAEIERKQSQLAEMVRRDPTFGRACSVAGPARYSSQSV